MTGHFYHADWSPDSASIATSDNLTGKVTVWDSNWQPQFELDGIGAVWSPDGTRLVTRAADIMVWDGQTGQEIYNLGEAADFSLFYNPIAWSPDGTRLAAGDVDGTITIWDAADGARTKRLAGP